MVFNHLEKILEPCSQDEFIASVWGKSYKHVRGWPGKFSELLPWDQLNKVLRQHRLDFPRLRLTRDGKSLPATDYLRYTTPARRKARIPHLKHAKLTEQLRAGATLVLDAVDELYEPLTELSESLELFFHEHIQINCYAGWRTSRGFDLHWDDHDVFILQVTGRKRWRVYGMTRPFPLAQDAEQAQKPDGSPLWEGTLEDGDLLYIPRGFWHVAFPLDEPTLHLTVGVHNRTGLDLLRWVAERMRASEIFRKDLPRFSSGAEREAHVSELRREFLAEWDSAELLKHFFEEQDAKAEARAHLSLPWSATTEVLPASNQTLVRLITPRPLELKMENGVVEFSCLKKRWRFAADALLILGPLAERRVCSVAELCEAARERLGEQRTRAFLRELILHGLLAVVHA